MSFDVEWSDEAWSELLAAFRVSTDRTSIKEAVQSADGEFVSHPLSVGESRDDDTIRVAVFAPLTIYFAVSPEEHRVRIVHVVAWDA